MAIAALPEHVRLLHVGPPKTGTTALQSAAAAHRRSLLAHGVRYPGTGIDHGAAVAAVTGDRWGWGGAGPGAPHRVHWAALLAEVRAEDRRRVLLGHEYAAKAGDEVIRRFDRDLGPRMIAAITLRDPAAMLPSIWQETLKRGSVTGFEEFLQSALRTPGERGADHPARNQGLLVERWARVLGPERVVVVAVDAARPEGLFSAFESLLALPPGLLSAGAEARGRAGNRGLTREEAAVLLGVNLAARRSGMRWDDYSALVEHGAVGALLEQRRPSRDEPRAVVPAWAHALLRERAADWTEGIRRSGVRVVGDLVTLMPPPDPAPQPPDDGRVGREVAVVALAGLIGTAAARGRDVRAAGVAGIDPREYLVVRNVGIAGLARVVLSRVLRRGFKALRLAAARMRSGGAP